jgi:hypothetical protein
MPAIAAHAERRRPEKSKRHARQFLEERETREAKDFLANYAET